MRHLDKNTWKFLVAHEDTKLRPPTNEHDLAAFEYRNGVRLPESYKEFLLRNNGGVLGRVRLYGVNQVDALDLDRIVREMAPELEQTRPDILPFASTWGGDYFCFDLSRGRRSANYPVVVQWHAYAEEPSEIDKLWRPFARDFVRFAVKACKEYWKEGV